MDNLITDNVYMVMDKIIEKTLPQYTPDMTLQKRINIFHSEIEPYLKLWGTFVPDQEWSPNVYLLQRSFNSVIMIGDNAWLGMNTGFKSSFKGIHGITIVCRYIWKTNTIIYKVEI